MRALERAGDDRARSRRMAGELAEDWERAARFDDDAGANAALRARHRAGRRDARARDAAAAGLGLACELLPPSAEDARQAAAQRFRRRPATAQRVPLARQSIFGPGRAEAVGGLARDRGIARLALRPRASAARAPTPRVAARKRRRE